MFRLCAVDYVQLTHSYGNPGIADLAESTVASTGLYQRRADQGLDSPDQWV
jgi:hypothetical protein